MTGTMTAAVLSRHGGADALEVRDDWPEPEPAQGTHVGKIVIVP